MPLTIAIQSLTKDIDDLLDLYEHAVSRIPFALCVIIMYFLSFFLSDVILLMSLIQQMSLCSKVCAQWEMQMLR